MKKNVPTQPGFYFCKLSFNYSKNRYKKFSEIAYITGKNPMLKISSIWATDDTSRIENVHNVDPNLIKEWGPQIHTDMGNLKVPYDAGLYFCKINSDEHKFHAIAKIVGESPMLEIQKIYDFGSYNAKPAGRDLYFNCDPSIVLVWGHKIEIPA